MDDQSNNAAFEPGQLNDDATTSPLQESVDSHCPATPPIGAAVTESQEPDPRPRTPDDEAGGQEIGQVHKIAIADISLPSNRRTQHEEVFEGLMTSMTVIGLQRPITVYRDEEADQFILIEGGHRLEAARRLGWTVIPAKILDWEPDQRRMWEISENLHRAELKALERDEQIAEWIELVEGRRQKDQILNEADKPSQVATVSKGGRGKEGGVRAAARELGISKDDAHRANKVAGLTEEAKEVARETGLDENRRVLLEAAKAEDSVAFLREESARRDSGENADANLVPNRDEECADFLLAEVEATKISTLISLMQSAKTKNVIEIIRRKLQPPPPSDRGATARGQKLAVKQGRGGPTKTQGTGKGTVFLRPELDHELRRFLASKNPAAKNEDVCRELRKKIDSVTDEWAHDVFEGYFAEHGEPETGKRLTKTKIHSLKKEQGSRREVANGWFPDLLDDVRSHVEPDYLEKKVLAHLSRIM